MTPLQVCEALIGPAPELAILCGYHRTAGYIWRNGSSSRKRGDLPSVSVMRKILDHSERHGLGLTTTHLIRGASAEEITAILHARQQVAA